MRQSHFLPFFFGSIIVILGVLAAGCTDTSGTGQQLPTPQVTPEIPGSVPLSASPTLRQEAPTVVEANNQFAFELYDTLRQDPKNEGKNIFFSPFSMSSALAMTYEGARGTTADEIASVFHFPRNDTFRRQQFADINAGINTGDPGYKLRTANALWVQKSYSFLPSYLQTLKQFFNAEATGLDFAHSPEESSATINKWVNNKTEGKIPELVSGNGLNANTRLIIANAVYFEGKWEKPFDPEDTTVKKFNVTPDHLVDVSMMALADDHLHLNYNETDLLQIVEMPYVHTSGRALSMLVVLPKGNNLTAVEDTLDAKNLSELRKSLKFSYAWIILPKYTIDARYGMAPALGNMGMPVAFTDGADFSGMDGSRNISISSVAHRAYVDVDETGTRAAAATAVIGYQLASAGPSPEPKVVRADHPFLFIIQDRDNGNILFMGRVMNPNGT